MRAIRYPDATVYIVEVAAKSVHDAERSAKGWHPIRQEVLDWLIVNAGHAGIDCAHLGDDSGRAWAYQHYHSGFEFYFRSNTVALLFKLTWGGTL